MTAQMIIKTFQTQQQIDEIVEKLSLAKEEIIVRIRPNDLKIVVRRTSIGELLLQILKYGDKRKIVSVNNIWLETVDINELRRVALAERAARESNS